MPPTDPKSSAGTKTTVKYDTATYHKKKADERRKRLKKKPFTRIKRQRAVKAGAKKEADDRKVKSNRELAEKHSSGIRKATLRMQEEKFTGDPTRKRKKN